MIVSTYSKFLTSNFQIKVDFPLLTTSFAQIFANLGSDRAKKESPLNVQTDSFRREQVEIIKECFSRHQGLILGELHTSRTSKRFLIENMKVLKELGVKYLFVEMHNSFENDLNVLYSSSEISPKLNSELKRLDIFWLASKELKVAPSSNNPVLESYEAQQKYNSRKLYSEATINGIKIIPIDHQEFSLRNLNAPQRLSEMNQFAEQKIKQTIASTDRYVVFCGIAHALRVNNDELGLSARLGNVSVIYSSDGGVAQNEISRDVFLHEANLSFMPDYYIEYGSSS